MGRKKKYSSGTSCVGISIENEVLDIIDTKAHEVSKNRSEFIVDILRDFAYNKKGFCLMMAKKSLQDFEYWKGRKEIIEKMEELQNE